MACFLCGNIILREIVLFQKYKMMVYLYILQQHYGLKVVAWFLEMLI